MRVGILRYFMGSIGNRQSLQIKPMKIDINKKYRTRDGKPVEYLHRVPEGLPTPYPWRGTVDGNEISWTDEGRLLSGERTSPFDLIEVREPREWTIRGFEDIDLVYAGPSLATGEIIRVREIID